jgi:ribosomal protein S18 acetylase RimI-like enzyme
MDDCKHSISMKLQLDEEDNKKIKSLEAICYKEQKIYLKLELDFKMQQKKEFIKNKMMREFLYYENDTLIGYLGLGNFGGDVVEISGMVNPKYRKRGIFKKLYLLAREEWLKICPSEVLALCDHTSIPGLAFLNSIGAEYASSEYKMCLNKKVLESAPSNGIELRAATSEDGKELYKQDSIYFDLHENEVDDKKVQENIQETFVQVDDAAINYLAELNGKIIGKIRITITDNEGFIYGFGVLPNFRGKGYGREILCLALNMLKKKRIDNIYLEVATENKNALGLYESCGFEEIFVMDYFVVS